MQSCLKQLKWFTRVVRIGEKKNPRDHREEELEEYEGKIIWMDRGD